MAFKNLLVAIGLLVMVGGLTACGSGGGGDSDEKPNNTQNGTEPENVPEVPEPIVPEKSNTLGEALWGEMKFEEKN